MYLTVVLMTLLVVLTLKVLSEAHHPYETRTRDRVLTLVVALVSLNVLVIVISRLPGFFNAS